MNTWKISHRLMAGFGLVIAILLGMSIFSVYIAQGIDAALSANSTQNAVIQRAAINFRGSAHDRSIAVRDAVLAPTPQLRDKEVQAIVRLADFYAESGKQMQKALSTSGAVPAEVAPMVKAIQEIEARTVDTTQKVLALVQAGDRTGAEALLWAQAKPQYEQWLAAINQLIDFEEKRIIANNSTANHEAKQFSSVMLVITLLAVLIGMATTTMVTRSIGSELGAEPSEVRAVVQAMQQGDLTVAIRTQPGDTTSVMAAVRDMQQRFHTLVCAVRNSIAQLHDTGGDIANGNQHLGARTEQTASSLEQTASSMEELTATVRQSADAARQASQLSTDAASTATKGGEVMQQVVSTMQEIHQRSAKIADIIGVIDGIAFQTNILALNAAVEAARAGEQGRGFAVVAGEVRSLAGRSAEAAREVQVLITDAVNKAEMGNAQAAQAGTSMQEIVSGIQRVAGIVDEIALASREQASGLAQINQAVSHLDGVTQQNAALVERSSAAAAALQQQAHHLAEVADTFRLEEQAGLRRPDLTALR